MFVTSVPTVLPQGAPEHSRLVKPESGPGAVTEARLRVRRELTWVDIADASLLGVVEWPS